MIEEQGKQRTKEHKMNAKTNTTQTPDYAARAAEMKAKFAAGKLDPNQHGAARVKALVARNEAKYGNR